MVHCLFMLYGPLSLHVVIIIIIIIIIIIVIVLFYFHFFIPFLEKRRKSKNRYIFFFYFFQCFCTRGNVRWKRNMRTDKGSVTGIFFSKTKIRKCSILNCVCVSYVPLHIKWCSWGRSLASSELCLLGHNQQIHYGMNLATGVAFYIIRA